MTATIRDGCAPDLDAVAYSNVEKNKWRTQLWGALRKQDHYETKVIPFLKRNQEHVQMLNPKARIENASTFTLRGGPVLYLAGENDLDARFALRAGVAPWNLIAVERSRAVATQLRERGRNVICGDIDSVLAAWPAHTPPSVVLADLQCGLSSAAVRVILFWSLLSPFKKSALVINLQRGREAQSSAPWMEGFFAFSDFCADGVDPISRHNPNKLSAKTRSVWGWLLAELFQREAFGNSLHLLVRELPSYRSNIVTMDSAVLFHTRGAPEGLSSVEEVRMLVNSSPILREHSPPLSDPCAGNVSRRIAAALAIRTMQREGKVKMKRAS